MSKRGKEYSDYVQNTQEDDRQYKDMNLEKKVSDSIFKDPNARQRMTAFGKSKIDNGKLKKLISSKYDIIISDNSAQIMATLGRFKRGRFSSGK
jgi:hypothetical protein